VCRSSTRLSARVSRVRAAATSRRMPAFQASCVSVSRSSLVSSLLGFVVLLGDDGVSRAERSGLLVVAAQCAQGVGAQTTLHEPVSARHSLGRGMRVTVQPPACRARGRCGR
jgi:hypothetical protein